MNRTLLTAAGLVLGLPLGAQTSAAFRLRFVPGADTASVEVRYDGCADAPLTVAMPAWKPGSYTIRDYGRNVVALSATNAADEPLAVAPVDTNTWRIDGAGADQVRVRCALRVTPQSGVGDGPSLGNGLGKGLGRPRRDGAGGPVVWSAYELEGPAVWLHVPGHVAIPHTVELDIPDDWSVATGLAASDASGRRFAAPDYDVLADCPLHVGAFERLALDVDGTRYEIVLSGFEHDRNDRDALVARYRRMIRAHHAFWSPVTPPVRAVPFDRYVFLIGFPGGGGLEHRNSTNLGMLDLSGSREGVNSGWDSLVSHEFFHAWNVKRLRPRALGPFDYAVPNRTRFLWWAEGVTSWCGDLLLVRAGIWDERLFWENAVAGEIRALQANPGRLKTSIADASWTVWDFPYMRRGRTAPDYYNKGMLLGLLLDVELRDATDGARSLDDVVRRLYERCTTTGHGFDDDDVRDTCAAVAGRSMDEFFTRYVDGTDELPFATTLAKIGLEVTAPDGDGASDDDGPRRRAWSVRIAEDAPPRAIRLRRGMTRPDGDDR